MSQQHIHLLYVPTLFCNLGCRYCYLGKQIDQNTLKQDQKKCVDTLDFALNKFTQSDILPFNVSLHGGEVSTLSETVLADLFSRIQSHYVTHYDPLSAQGFKKYHPHVKTNLFNFDRLYDLFHAHSVSISASIDLPFAMHEKYRTTKKGSSTLQQSLDNVRLLSQYPHQKKISTTLFAEHQEHTDQLIDDIWTMHKSYGFDMNQFNFMFGFESALNDEKFADTDISVTRAVSDQQQVDFYQTLKQAFIGTELEYGFKHNWFDEFTPSYCTNALNCGERFFLLQSDGNIYSCVRGQGVPEFHYGNIFEHSVESILQNAKQQIKTIHQHHGLHQDCQQCDYLHLCHTGCAFVKHQQKNGKSYTCALQKTIYQDYPLQYPASQRQQQDLTAYTIAIHPNHTLTNTLKNTPEKTQHWVTPELYDPTNRLDQLIQDDDNLAALYDSNAIILTIDDQPVTLTSQILKTVRQFHHFNREDQLVIHMPKSLFSVNCQEQTRNTLYCQMLQDKAVTYGDEQRVKQAHIATQQVFFDLLEDSNHYGESHIMWPMNDFLNSLKTHFSPDVLNNCFITTGYLRDYHYEKQKKNAFYHIQAINLPFQNFEFYWLT